MNTFQFFNGSQKPLLIIFNGESNSGGLASNSDATSKERTINSQLQYLNNSTLQFEDWNIGDSLLGHLDFYEGQPYHGWDLGLSELTKVNYFGNRKVFLVKTGAGNSQIAQWVPGGLYDTNFNTRVSAAKALIDGPHDTVVWYTQGINDSIHGNDIPPWKTKTIEHFEAMRASFGMMPIIMTIIEQPIIITAQYTAATAAMPALVDNVYGITTKNLPTDGIYHWNYSGMKTIATRMAAITKVILPR